VRLQQRLGDLGRLELVATAVLDVDHRDLGYLAFDLIDQAVAAPGARGAGLDRGRSRPLRLATDLLGHLVGGQGRGGLLSVCAVVSGMGLSTPESNAITGSSRPGPSSAAARGLASSAARPIALGFLASAADSMSICLSTCCSGLGAFERHFDLVVFGRLVGAFFTACQNWCWKPFEISGM